MSDDDLEAAAWERKTVDGRPPKIHRLEVDDSEPLDRRSDWKEYVRGLLDEIGRELERRSVRDEDGGWFREVEDVLESHGWRRLEEVGGAGNPDQGGEQ